MRNEDCHTFLNGELPWRVIGKVEGWCSGVEVKMTYGTFLLQPTRSHAPPTPWTIFPSHSFCSFSRVFSLCHSCSSLSTSAIRPEKRSVCVRVRLVGVGFVTMMEGRVCAPGNTGPGSVAKAF